ncbi:hypothetical protein ABBQ38_009189 [Trebouxia sp. C0009 RCD-2024]
MGALVPVTTSPCGLEYSVHSCPRRHWTEVSMIFPGLTADKLLIVPTCQHSKMDLVQTGEAVETEKDDLLEKFMEFAKGVCNKATDRGHWADYIDPCSGLPMMHTNCTVPYGEVDGMSALLGYQTANAAGCKVLIHPRWGTSVYPATLFTKAPVTVLKKIIEEVEAETTDTGYYQSFMSI